MKIKLILFLTVVIICTVKSQSQQPNPTYSLKKFSFPNESIRAIEVLNDSLLAFATSNGTIGFLNTTGTTTLHKVKYDSIAPHFRAISSSGNNLFALSVGNPALLFKYTNNKHTLVYKEMHEHVFYNTMKFFDERNGIAIGDPTGKCLSVIITRNGGSSWNKIPCNKLPEAEKGEAAFAASNTNISAIGSSAWLVTGGKKSRVFFTPDMGKTWKVFNSPIIEGTATTGIYTVDFYNDKIGVIAGGDYTKKHNKSVNKAITINGGETWSPIATNSPPHYISCIQFVPNGGGKKIVAVSTNGIFYSSNTGESWKKISDEPFYTIRFVNENLAWLAGNEVIAKMVVNFDEYTD